jgi:hypothetical protein
MTSSTTIVSPLLFIVIIVVVICDSSSLASIRIPVVGVEIIIVVVNGFSPGLLLIQHPGQVLSLIILIVFTLRIQLVVRRSMWVCAVSQAKRRSALCAV